MVDESNTQPNSSSSSSNNNNNNNKRTLPSPSSQPDGKRSKEFDQLGDVASDKSTVAVPVDGNVSNSVAETMSSVPFLGDIGLKLTPIAWPEVASGKVLIKCSKNPHVGQEKNGDLSVEDPRSDQSVCSTDRIRGRRISYNNGDHWEKYVCQSEW